MEWSQASTWTKMAACVVGALAILSTLYVFLWGRISWLPPRKK